MFNHSLSSLDVVITCEDIGFDQIIQVRSDQTHGTYCNKPDWTLHNTATETLRYCLDGVGGRLPTLGYDG